MTARRLKLASASSVSMFAGVDWSALKLNAVQERAKIGGKGESDRGKMRWHSWLIRGRFLFFSSSFSPCLSCARYRDTVFSLFRLSFSPFFALETLRSVGLNDILVKAEAMLLLFFFWRIKENARRRRHSEIILDKCTIIVRLVCDTFGAFMKRDIP